MVHEIVRRTNEDGRKELADLELVRVHPVTQCADSEGKKSG